MTLPPKIRPDVEMLITAFTASPFANNIVKIILFGSHSPLSARKHQPDSDIDIALVVKEPPGKDQRAEYGMLTDIISPREVDLVICTEETLYSGMYVFAEILREGVTVYENV